MAYVFNLLQTKEKGMNCPLGCEIGINASIDALASHLFYKHDEEDVARMLAIKTIDTPKIEVPDIPWKFENDRWVKK